MFLFETQNKKPQYLLGFWEVDVEKTTDCSHFYPLKLHQHSLFTDEQGFWTRIKYNFRSVNNVGKFGIFSTFYNLLFFRFRGWSHFGRLRIFNVRPSPSCIGKLFPLRFKAQSLIIDCCCWYTQRNGYFFTGKSFGQMFPYFITDSFG